jgi:3-phosphoinositide dependent protein kinase-1
MITAWVRTSYPTILKVCKPQLGSLSLECSRFYAAEILDAVIWMHGLGIIHRCVKFNKFAMVERSVHLSTSLRDMKPENVLLDEKLRVKITDFGTAKILNESALGQFQ